MNPREVKSPGTKTTIYPESCNYIFSYWYMSIHVQLRLIVERYNTVRWPCRWQRAKECCCMLPPYQCQLMKYPGKKRLRRWVADWPYSYSDSILFSCFQIDFPDLLSNFLVLIPFYSSRLCFFFSYPLVLQSWVTYIYFFLFRTPAIYSLKEFNILIWYAI